MAPVPKYSFVAKYSFMPKYPFMASQKSVNPVFLEIRAKLWGPLERKLRNQSIELNLKINELVDHIKNILDNIQESGTLKFPKCALSWPSLVVALILESKCLVGLQLQIMAASLHKHFTTCSPVTKCKCSMCHNKYKWSSPFSFLLGHFNNNAPVVVIQYGKA